VFSASPAAGINNEQVEKWDEAAATGTGSPAGSVLVWLTGTPPPGYLECNGASISRTTYAALFEVLGTRYGSTDGNSFNLPDLRGQFLRGWDHSAGVDPDSGSRTDRGDGTTGDHVGTRQEGQIQSHKHNITARDIAGTYGGDQNFWEIGGGGKSTEHTGGNETRPRNINVMWVIKY